MDFNGKLNITSLLDAFTKGQISLEEAASQIHFWIDQDHSLLELVPPSSPILAQLDLYKQQTNRLGIDLITIDQISCVVRTNQTVQWALEIDSFGQVKLSVRSPINELETHHAVGRLTDWVHVKLLLVPIATYWPGENISLHADGDPCELTLFAKSEAVEKCVSRWCYDQRLQPSEIQELLYNLQGMAQQIASSR